MHAAAFVSAEAGLRGWAARLIRLQKYRASRGCGDVRNTAGRWGRECCRCPGVKRAGGPIATLQVKPFGAASIIRYSFLRCCGRRVRVLTLSRVPRPAPRRPRAITSLGSGSGLERRIPNFGPRTGETRNEKRRDRVVAFTLTAAPGESFRSERRDKGARKPPEGGEAGEK